MPITPVVSCAGLQAEYEREAIEWSYVSLCSGAGRGTLAACWSSSVMLCRLLESAQCTTRDLACCPALPYPHCPAASLQIEFVDNQDVLDLIEARMGILDLLDESCRFPKVRGCGSCRWTELRAGSSCAWVAGCPKQAACHTLSSPLNSCRQATHEDFANKLYGAPSVSNSKRFSKPKLSRTDFTIDHYAGEECWVALHQGSHPTSIVCVFGGH